ncbi:MAG: hypothetical protein OEL88_16625 [Sterolibacteriaceae bacterium MAG5]|nr:hypothetical protein [Candidatus Nitricoxidireducens bremensis]
MKHKLVVVTLATALCAGLGPVRAAEHHHHGHDHVAQPAKLQLDQGRKWATDEALRKSMASLRESFAAQLEPIHKGRLDVAGYKALGEKIEGEVANIVAQCKLDAKADAMLHIVVGDLLAAADVLQGKAAGKPAGAAHRAVTALNAYGRYFDHPGWKSLK